MRPKAARGGGQFEWTSLVSASPMPMVGQMMRRQAGSGGTPERMHRRGGGAAAPDADTGVSPRRGSRERGPSRRPRQKISLQLRVGADDLVTVNGERQTPPRRAQKARGRSPASPRVRKGAPGERRRSPRKSPARSARGSPARSAASPARGGGAAKAALAARKRADALRKKARANARAAEERRKREEDRRRAAESKRREVRDSWQDFVRSAEERLAESSAPVSYKIGRSGKKRRALSVKVDATASARKKEAFSSPDPDPIQTENGRGRRRAAVAGDERRRKALEGTEAAARRPHDDDVDDEDLAGGGWTSKQKKALRSAFEQTDPTKRNFWRLVAAQVEGKDETECAHRYFNASGATPDKAPRGAANAGAANAAARRMYHDAGEEDDLFRATPGRRGGGRPRAKIRLRLNAADVVTPTSAGGAGARAEEEESPAIGGMGAARRGMRGMMKGLIKAKQAAAAARQRRGAAFSPPEASQRTSASVDGVVVRAELSRGGRVRISGHDADEDDGGDLNERLQNARDDGEETEDED